MIGTDTTPDFPQQVAVFKKKFRYVKGKVQRCSIWSQFPDHAPLSELFRA